MVSKKDEFVWDVDDFPDEPQELDVERSPSPAANLPPPLASSSSNQVAEINPSPSTPPEQTQKPPALQLPGTTDTPPTLAPSAPEPLTGSSATPSLPNPIASTPPPIPTTIAGPSASVDPVHVPRQMVRGERLDLNTFLQVEPQITIELIGLSPASVKFLCLGLDADGRMLGADYCVGPRQPISPCGGIQYRAKIGGGHSIVLCPSSLPTQLARLEFVVVVAAVDAVVGSGATGVRILSSVGAAESADLASNCAGSACATLAEVYKRQNQWRFRIIGEVLANSVDELLKKHGAARERA